MADEQTADLVAEVNDFIRDWGFETLPHEECEKRNQELWNNSLLGRKRACHGCGKECTEFSMLYIYQDHQDEMDELTHRLVKGQETFTSYNKKMDALIHRVDPSDGYYCSYTCYEIHTGNA